MNAALPLFAYGSLMFSPVIGAVIGRNPPGRPATVHGFLRLEVAGQTFPGLIASPDTPGSIVNGILYPALSREEWRLLNEFEDTFYVLTEITVLVDGQETAALAYLVPESERGVLNGVPWNEDFFREKYMKRFVSER